MTLKKIIESNYVISSILYCSDHIQSLSLSHSLSFSLSLSLATYQCPPLTFSHSLSLPLSVFLSLSISLFSLSPSHSLPLSLPLALPCFLFLSLTHSFSLSRFSLYLILSLSLSLSLSLALPHSPSLPLDFPFLSSPSFLFHFIPILYNCTQCYSTNFWIIDLTLKLLLWYRMGLPCHSEIRTDQILCTCYSSLTGYQYHSYHLLCIYSYFHYPHNHHDICLHLLLQWSCRLDFQHFFLYLHLLLFLNPFW